MWSIEQSWYPTCNQRCTCTIQQSTSSDIIETTYGCKTHCSLSIIYSHNKQNGGSYITSTVCPGHNLSTHVYNLWPLRILEPERRPHCSKSPTYWALRLRLQEFYLLLKSRSVTWSDEVGEDVFDVCGEELLVGLVHLWRHQLQNLRINQWLHYQPNYMSDLMSCELPGGGPCGRR